METVKSLCFGSLNGLYLGQCAVGIKQETEKVESERQALQSIQHEAEECEKTKAKKKAECFSGQGQFWHKYTSDLKAEGCIRQKWEVIASLALPEIELSEVQELLPRCLASMPWTSRGDLVVPGGGEKLNVAVGHHCQQGQSEGQQQAKLTFDQGVANIKDHQSGHQDFRGSQAEDGSSIQRNTQ
ncbi:unnamed protein product [Symbiodinium sp. CCMP2456]|nr:unnamed protein product [Symbiodinium sp. CCMP2456]